MSVHKEYTVTQFIFIYLSILQGDTIQNVANDLERVLETGCYSFNIPENVADLGELQLRYKPSSKRTPPEPPNEEKSLVVFDEEETWDSEQIDGFARKLGFLDSKKADGEMVQSFLHVNEVCDFNFTFGIIIFSVYCRHLGATVYVQCVKMTVYFYTLYISGRYILRHLSKTWHSSPPQVHETVKHCKSHWIHTMILIHGESLLAIKLY